MTPFDVYLNMGRDTLEDGGPLAHLPALAGCVARGSDEGEALARLRQGAEEYIELHGLDLDATEIEFRVHKVEVNVFPWDFQPLSDEEIQTYFGRMETSRHALLDLIDDLSDEVLDWQRAETTWPIRRILEHVADAEWWYITRLTDWPPDALQRLEATHAFVLNTVRGWSAAELAQVFVWGRHREWSARKVLRVLAANEEAERRAIERLLAWKKEGRSPEAPIPEIKTDTLEGDLEALAPRARDAGLAHQEASRAELLALIEGLADETLDSRPAPKERSIRQILQRLADDEWWVATRLQDRPQEPLERLRSTRQGAIDHLRRLAPQERARVTLHSQEEWTVRKVFRRMLEHEWEHRQQVRELLEVYQQSALAQ